MDYDVSKESCIGQVCVCACVCVCVCVCVCAIAGCSVVNLTWTEYGCGETPIELIVSYTVWKVFHYRLSEGCE